MGKNEANIQTEAELTNSLLHTGTLKNAQSYTFSHARMCEHGESLEPLDPLEP